MGRDELKDFIIKNSDLLWENEHALGIWESGNFIYLDVVKIFRKDYIICFVNNRSIIDF